MFTGPAGTDGDATGASGGMVRGFETDPHACQDAAASMAELQVSARMRAWADYHEVGSVYLVAPGTDPAASLATIEQFLPGSATLPSRHELMRDFPFRDLPVGTTAVLEQRAGYVSPARLRAAVLGYLAGAGVAIHDRPVAMLIEPAQVRTVDGAVTGYDAVVVAAGAWTPRLLRDSGLAADGMRTKQIQYSVHGVAPTGLGAFVDETTGLYGRLVPPDSFLLGLGCDRWDVDPGAVTPDLALAEEVVRVAAGRLSLALDERPPDKVVASFDCYHHPPGLALRRCAGSLYTFTGGCGGAAKTVLAASRTAAAALLHGARSR
jgi:glycine/D-amino acid oxidase-like deaminating enzyme